MTIDVTGKKELTSLKFDWKIYQLNAASTKCCAGGTQDLTGRHGGQKDRSNLLIPKQHDEKVDAKSITEAFGYLRH